MINHCRQELPYEACGLLSGTGGKNETVWKMENMERSPVSFSMDLDQMEQTFHSIKKRAQQLTGIYHSHPTGIPFPSRNDIQHAHYPHAAYFIVSLASSNPSVKCYRIQNQRVIPLTIGLLD
jgi:proteasome lid subunit RPN8/RPN11